MAFLFPPIRRMISRWNLFFAVDFQQVQLGLPYLAPETVLRSLLRYAQLLADGFPINSVAPTQQYPITSGAETTNYFLQFELPVNSFDIISSVEPLLHLADPANEFQALSSEPALLDLPPYSDSQ